VFTDTVTDVFPRIVSQACARRLEVNATFDLGQIAASQVSGTTQELRKNRGYSGQNNFRKFTRSHSRISGLVDGKSPLPIFR